MASHLEPHWSSPTLAATAALVSRREPQRADRISTASEARLRAIPTIASSARLGWTSVLVEQRRLPTQTELELAASPDHALSIVLEGRYQVDHFSDGIWRRTPKSPNQACIIARGQSATLRPIIPAGQKPQVLHVMIPHRYFELAHDEYLHGGSPKPLLAIPNMVAFVDPIVSGLCSALLTGVLHEAPEMYAQSAAQFLATHLVCRTLAAGVAPLKSPGRLSDVRIARVVEYIRANFDQPISLDDLAREAGASRFHFNKLFKNATGHPPYRFLTFVRLAGAIELLRETELSVAEITTRVGYVSVTHFTTSFRARYGQTPAVYRRSARKERREPAVAIDNDPSMFRWTR